MSANFLCLTLLSTCTFQNLPESLTEVASPTPVETYNRTSFEEGTWEHFLQNLPTQSGTIVDYKGASVADQQKHTALIDYDIGKQDLQQCADALIRLRAEYLFKQGRHEEIGFHFTSGDYYTWSDYRLGKRPVAKGNGVTFQQGLPQDKSHASLRRYLDIVYAYAGTISLHARLKKRHRFGIGTIIIKPGSPGHCCMIIDEAKTMNGKRLFKLAEGYTPAQSIYILKNQSDGTSWHELKEGEPVLTASYSFYKYDLRQF